jgi:hypothetical protein
MASTRCRARADSGRHRGWGRKLPDRVQRRRTRYPAGDSREDLHTLVHYQIAWLGSRSADREASGGSPQGSVAHRLPAGGPHNDGRSTSDRQQLIRKHRLSTRSGRNFTTPAVGIPQSQQIRSREATRQGLRGSSTRRGAGIRTGRTLRRQVVTGNASGRKSTIRLA